MKFQDDIGPYKCANDQPGVERQWTIGILGCFDDIYPNGLMSLFCPCISLGKISQRIGISYAKILVGFGLLWLSALLFWAIAGIDQSFWWLGTLFFALAFALSLRIRTKVRTALQLHGSFCDDCFYSFFCPCCSIAQMAAQANVYESGKCSFKETLPAFTMA